MDIVQPSHAERSGLSTDGALLPDYNITMAQSCDVDDAHHSLPLDDDDNSPVRLHCTNTTDAEPVYLPVDEPALPVLVSASNTADNNPADLAVEDAAIPVLSNATEKAPIELSAHDSPIELPHDSLPHSNDDDMDPPVLISLDNPALMVSLPDSDDDHEDDENMEPAVASTEDDNLPVLLPDSDDETGHRTNRQLSDESDNQLEGVMDDNAALPDVLSYSIDDSRRTQSTDLGVPDSSDDVAESISSRDVGQSRTSPSADLINPRVEASFEEGSSGQDRPDRFMQRSSNPPRSIPIM